MATTKLGSPTAALVARDQAMAKEAIDSQPAPVAGALVGALYLRDSGVSTYVFSRQLAEALALAHRLAIQIPAEKVYVDAAGGGSLERPALAAMRLDLAAGGCQVVVSTPTSLSRKHADLQLLLAEFARQGVAVEYTGASQPLFGRW